MKREISFISAIVLVLFTIIIGGSGCQGGTDSMSSADGLLEDLSASVGDYEKKMLDAFEIAVNSSTNGREIYNVWKSKCREIDSIAVDAILAEAEKLKDKEFATEVDSGIPWKIITPFKIDLENTKKFTGVGDASSNNIPDSKTHIALQFYTEVENTEDVGFTKMFVILLDKTGTPLFPLEYERYDDLEDGYATSAKKGSKGKFQAAAVVTPWNVELLSRVDRFLITNGTVYFKLKNSTFYMKKKSYENKFDSIARKRIGW